MADDERFPLDLWFDVTRPITKAQRAAAEEQIRFYAVKGGYGQKAVRRTIGQMRAAIRAHNTTVTGR